MEENQTVTEEGDKGKQEKISETRGEKKHISRSRHKMLLWLLVTH